MQVDIAILAAIVLNIKLAVCIEVFLLLDIKVSTAASNRKSCRCELRQSLVQWQRLWVTWPTARGKHPPQLQSGSFLHVHGKLVTPCHAHAPKTSHCKPINPQKCCLADLDSC